MFIYLYHNGMHTTAASSLYIVIGPAVKQFVIRLCIGPRHIESRSPTWTLSKQMWSVIKVSQYMTRMCLESKVRIVATPHCTDIYASKPIHIVASAHYVDI